MYKIIIIFGIYIVGLLPCNGQMLEPKPVQIALMDSTIKNAKLYAYTNDALVVNKITNDSDSGKFDTLPYITIEKITFTKIYNRYKNRIGGTLIGMGSGAIIGFAYGAGSYGTSGNSLIDFGFLFSILDAMAGAAIGAITGAITGAIKDAGRQPRTFNINRDKIKFIKFVEKYAVDDLRY